MTNALKNAQRLASRTRLSLAVSDAYFKQAEAACAKAFVFQRGVSANLKIVMRKLGPSGSRELSELQVLLKRSNGMETALSDAVDAIDELRVRSMTSRNDLEG